MKNSFVRVLYEPLNRFLKIKEQSIDRGMVKGKRISAANGAPIIE